MGNWDCTITAISSKDCLNAIELTMVFFTFESTNHFLYKVIDVEELHIYGWVIDGDRKVISNIVTKSSNS